MVLARYKLRSRSDAGALVGLLVVGIGAVAALTAVSPAFAAGADDPAMQEGREALERCTAAAEEGSHVVADAAGKEAATAFERALETAPDSVEARMGAAKARLFCRIAQAPMMEKMSLMEEIERLFTEVLERRSGHWEARYLLASLLYNVPPFLGRTGDAVTHFERLIAQQEEDGEPTRAEPYLYLGELLLRQDRHEEAREVWRRGRERYPDHAGLAERLAELTATDRQGDEEPGSGKDETGVSEDRSLENRLRQRLEDAVDRPELPGVAVALVRGDERLLVAGFGFADLENEVPVTAETVFRIGSVSKQLTAAALLRLVDSGKLSLTDSLAPWLPEAVRSNVTGITLADLLTHTAGLPTDAAESARWIEDSLTRPRVGAPGERYHYSNLGYALLGHVLTQVTGRSFEVHLRETLLEPLGMTATRICDSHRIIPRRAEGYTWRGDRLLNDDPVRFTPSLLYGGGLCSTAEDLARWLRALHGGEVLGETSYRAMITPPAVEDEEGTTYGMGVRVHEPRGRRVIHHSGGISGFAAETAFYPEASLAVVVLTNSEAGKPRELGYELAEMVLGGAP